jgi:hypothetical protein
MLARQTVRDRLAMAGLAGLVVFLHRGALFSGGVIYKRDVHLVWHPQVEGFVRAVLSGALPLWDPCPSFGQPLLADASSQVLYPLTWLNLLMQPWVYYTVFSMLHALLAATGSYRLARHLGASSAGAFVAGALWIVSGPFVSLVDLWHHYASAAWIPWVLLAAQRAFDRPGPRRVAVFGAAVALQILAGSADVCAMTLLVAAADLLLRIDWRRASAPANLRLAATGLGAVALGVGLSAVLWTSSLELALRTPRGTLPEAIRTYWSVHPLTTLEFLYPGLWSSLPLAPSLRAVLFESREPFLASLYLGVPTLALVAGGIALRPSRVLKFWLAVAVVAALVSLGRHAVFYQFGVLLLPPLRVLRYPVKTLVMASFAVALLAGLGLDAWRSEGAPAGRRWRLGVLLPLALVAVVGLSGALLLYWDASTWAPLIVAGTPSDAAAARTLLAPARAPLLSASLLAGVCALIAVLRARASRSWPWAAALAALAVADLAVYHRYAIPLAPTALYAHRPPVVDGLKQMGAARIYVYDYSQADQNQRLLGREVGHVLASMPAGWSPDSALALGMQQSLAPATAGRWDLKSGFEIDYRGLQAGYLSRLMRAVRELGPEAQLRLLRVGAVTHVVALHARGFENLVPGPSWETLLADRVRVFGVPEPLARARVVAGVRVADGADGLATILDPGFDPASEILLSEGAPSPASAAPPGSVRISQERADHIVLEVDVDRPGYVVLADAFDPGWHATLDGAAVPLLRANLAFRAVAAPPGRHAVELVYRPPAFWVGLLVSAASLLLALVLAARPEA